MRVLIAYATRYGSTAEVAEAIAETLRAAGFAADVRDVRTVREVNGYGAVVFGAPFYLARMLRSGRWFLRKHRLSLARLPVAAFVLGLSPAKAKQRRLERLLRKRPAIRPVSVGLFGGVVDRSKLRFRDRTPPIRRLPALVDERDWDAIRSWAAELPTKLFPRAPSPD